jgi:hypothetical protein
MIFSAQDYIIAVLVGCLLLVGTLYKCTRDELVETKSSLAVAVEVNEVNKEALQRLDLSIQSTDRVVAAWDKDRTTLAAVRNATRNAIMEAMNNNEIFKIWASGIAPDDAWRMLNANHDENGSGAASPAYSAPAGLPGNADPEKRDKP